MKESLNQLGEKIESKDLLENVKGGKKSKSWCTIMWLSCVQNSVWPCGTSREHACDLYKKYCS